MSALSSERLSALLDPVVVSCGADLEGVTVRKAGKRSSIVVAVDKDGGMSMDAVAEVSRAISEFLDASDAVGNDPYVLEVGSPGVDRPLTLPRHWRRARTRLVEIKLADATTITGRIASSDESSVDIELAKSTRTISYDDIEKALVQVEFNRVADADLGDESEMAVTEDSEEESGNGH